MNEIEDLRKLVGEAVRFAVFAASLDETFGGDGPIRLDVADPTIAVTDARNLHPVAGMIVDRVNAGDSIELSWNWAEGEDLVPGSEIRVTWEHTTRTGRAYQCTVFVVLDT